MACSITLRVRLNKETAERFGPSGFNIPWAETQPREIRCSEPPLTIEDIAAWIEARVEGIYFQQTGGEDRGQAQVQQIRRAGSSRSRTLPWGDHADQYLRDGDTIVIGCAFVTEWMAASRQPKFTEEELQVYRSMLRFGLNDRVLCYCGPRWLSGLVVGTAVPEEKTLLPYLVKTDPLPGLPSRTISVPSDRDDVCVQEVCFDPKTQLELVQAAAQAVKESARPKLRFAVGDRVVVRVRNSAEDALEQWLPGAVCSTWPQLGGERKWELGDVAGEFPDAVPYQVDLGSAGLVYCHRDHFTLIRREGMQPQTRVKGISKRMEVVTAADGSREQVDHQTERRKRFLASDLGDDSE